MGVQESPHRSRRGYLKAIDRHFRKKGARSSLSERVVQARAAWLARRRMDQPRSLIEARSATPISPPKSEPFLKLAANAAKALLHDPNTDISTVAEVNQEATEVAQTTGENIRVGKTAYVKAPAGGKAGLYIYTPTGKIGVIMAFSGNANEEIVRLHRRPHRLHPALGLTRAEVPADLVAKEKSRSPSKPSSATGKPQQIAEKIAEGKLNSFFAERVLLDQEFFNAQVFKGSIANFLKQNGVGLEKYIRLEVGQQ